MGIMVYSFLWVMQGIYHQLYLLRVSRCGVLESRLESRVSVMDVP